jgi:hypothetical protein
MHTWSPDCKHVLIIITIVLFIVVVLIVIIIVVVILILILVLVILVLVIICAQLTLCVMLLQLGLGGAVRSPTATSQTAHSCRSAIWGIRWWCLITGTTPTPSMSKRRPRGLSERLSAAWGRVPTSRARSRTLDASRVRLMTSIIFSELSLQFRSEKSETGMMAGVGTTFPCLPSSVLRLLLWLLFDFSIRSNPDCYCYHLFTSGNGKGKTLKYLVITTRSAPLILCYNTHGGDRKSNMQLQKSKSLMVIVKRLTPV